MAKPFALALALLMAGCTAAPAPTLTALRAPAPAPASVQAAAPMTAPRIAVIANAPTVAQLDPLEGYRRVAAAGGLIRDFTADIAGAEDGYGLLVVPADSQAKADKAAQAWAPDARPIFAGYGYWKKSFVSFVRHGYYSKTKDRALMLDFAVSKVALIHKSDEAGDNYRAAAAVLGSATDTNAYTAKRAMALALANGYTPHRFHVAALLNLAYFGAVWVYLDDRDWSPAMLVDAHTGTVIKTGPAMEAVRLLMAPFEKGSPSPTPSGSPDQDHPETLPPSSPDVSPSPTTPPSGLHLPL